MAGSSIIVALNGVALKRLRLPKTDPLSSRDGGAQNTDPS